MARKNHTKPKAKKRVKGKVKLTQRASVVEKNDATRVASDTASYVRMQARPPADVGVTFRVKVKRK